MQRFGAARNTQHLRHRPTAVAAGRQIEYGNSGRAGTVGRGSRRRACAVVYELELCCSAWKRVIGRSADPVEPNCHGGNLRHNNRLRCHALREKLAFRPNVRFRADFVCSTPSSRHSGQGWECLRLTQTGHSGSPAALRNVTNRSRVSGSLKGVTLRTKASVRPGTSDSNLKISVLASSIRPVAE